MKYHVLGIESSCDDTCASIVTSDKQILSNIVISQIKEHEKYQGVVPEIAARSHISNIGNAIDRAIAKAGIKLSEIDAVAATCGPGLIGGVIVGAVIGKALSSTLAKPFVAVNHLEGHILTPRLISDIDFPYLALLVSGGHCQFIAVFGVGNYKILGETLDDAVGEAFDKTAKLLSLGFPGGPEIEKLAKFGRQDAYQLPLSMTDRSGCDMSFSGIKTAVRRVILAQSAISQEFIYDICASFQYTISEILARRAMSAIEIFSEMTDGKSKSFILAGGVASNMYIRERLKLAISSYGFDLIVPEISLCTDNAAMIAWAGIERLKLGIKNDLSFCPVARWSLEDLKI